MKYRKKVHPHFGGWTKIIRADELGKTRHSLFFRHGKILVVHAGGLVTPGRINVIGGAIQSSYGPDMVCGRYCTAFNALKLQQ